MFPFNQSYRPRQPSPDLPPSPVSMKAMKRRRMKARHSPYPRPLAPLPSSPSDGEFDGMRDCDPYSLDENVIRCANLMDLTLRPSPEMPSKEDTSVEGHTALKEENFEHKERQQLEETLEGNSNAGNEISQSEKQQSPGPDDHGVSLPETPVDHTEVNAGTGHIHKETPLQTSVQPRLKLTFSQSNPKTGLHNYGDLVVVDYAEKKKVHKWPAIIVPPDHMTDNMLDYPPEEHDTKDGVRYCGVRWIESTPSYSWVPEHAAVKLTPEMIEEFLATTKGPKKLIQSWEMAKNPPTPFEYLLEKKMNYHMLVEKYKYL